MSTASVDVNMREWQGGNHVDGYASRALHPAEITIMLRYREALSNRVLEIGAGAGRILGYLVELGGQVDAIDISEAMVEYCRRLYPTANVTVGDLRDLGSLGADRYDAVVAFDNVLDVLDDEGRRSALAAIKEILAPGGVLLFSSHNLAQIDAPRPGLTERLRGALRVSPARVIRAAINLPRRARNRRRLAPLQTRARDHAILNDEAHDYAFLHYYIRRDEQARQLAEVGYELIECLDDQGQLVAVGDGGDGACLHYVARPAP